MRSIGLSVAIAISAGCGGGNRATYQPPPPGAGGPLPSGLSAGAACKPEQCAPAASEPVPCADGTEPPARACVTDVFNKCVWQGGQCPVP